MQSKNTQKPRRKYDASFKQEVVNMMASGRAVPDIARSLGVDENIIYRWRRQALGHTDQTTASVTLTAPAQVSLAEHLALQKRMRELKMEWDISKKALSIFSRPQ